MRKLTLTMIILWSILGLVIVTALVGGIVLRRTNAGAIGIIGGADGPTTIFYSGSDRELLVDESINSTGIDKIELSLGSDTIDIYESGDDMVRIMQYGRNLSEDWIVEAQQRGETLKISRTKSSVQWGTVNSKSWVELYLPASYRGDLDFNLSSGSIEIHTDLDVERFDLQLSSGNVNNRYRISADKADITISSGNLHLSEIAADKYELQVSSGKMELGALTGSGEIQVSSGNVKLGRVTILESMSARASSGSMTIELAGEPSLDFKGSRSSGNINTYFPTESTDKQNRTITAKVGSGPYKELDVHISSGNVSIKRAD